MVEQLTGFDNNTNKSFFTIARHRSGGRWDDTDRTRVACEPLFFEPGQPFLLVRTQHTDVEARQTLDRVVEEKLFHRVNVVDKGRCTTGLGRLRGFAFAREGLDLRLDVLQEQLDGLDAHLRVIGVLVGQTVTCLISFSTLPTCALWMSVCRLKVLS